VRLLGGLLAVVTAMVVCATVADVLHIPLPAPIVSMGALATFGAAAYAKGELGRTPRRRGERLIWTVTALGVVMCLPKIFGDTAAHISRLVYGYDNVHHVRMALATALERGYFWSADGIPGVYEAGGGYRPGTSMVATYLPWIATGGYDPPRLAEVIQGAESVYALLMVVVTAACIMLLRELAWDGPNPASSRAVAVSGTALALAILGGFAPVVTQRGFQAQSLATTAAVGGLVMLIQRRAGLTSGGMVLLGWSAVLVAMHAWPLAAVPLAFVVAALSLREWRRLGTGARAGAGLLVLVAGYPIYGPRLISSASSIPTDTSFLSSTSPAVLPLPASTWAPALAAAVVVALLWWQLGLHRGVTRVITLAVAGALLTTVLVGGAQLHNGRGLGGYYLQKTVYLTTLIGFVLVAAVLSRLVTGSNQRHRPVIVAGASATMLMMWAPLATPWAVTHWTNQDPNLLDMRAVQASLSQEVNGSTTGSDIIVLGSCNNTTSDYTTRWTGTLLRSWTPSREQLVNRLGTEGESLAALREYARNEAQRRIDLYANPACPLATEIRNAKLPNVVIHVG
jgi:hypothetical protein